MTDSHLVGTRLVVICWVTIIMMIMMMTLGAMDCESNLYSRGKMKNMMRRLANYVDFFKVETFYIPPL